MLIRSSVLVAIRCSPAGRAARPGEHLWMRSRSATPRWWNKLFAGPAINIAIPQGTSCPWSLFDVATPDEQAPRTSTSSSQPRVPRRTRRRRTVTGAAGDQAAAGTKSPSRSRWSRSASTLRARETTRALVQAAAREAGSSSSSCKGADSTRCPAARRRSTAPAPGDRTTSWSPRGHRQGTPRSLRPARLGRSLHHLRG